MDSALDSTNPQNPHKKHKMDGCVVWLIEVSKGERILLLAKAKSSKNFCALRARFCGFVFSCARFYAKRRILQWEGKGGIGFCAR